jgi:MFS family permease
MRRGLAISIPFFTGFGGFLFVYAVAMQTFLDWSPVRAGLAIAPLAVAFLIASLLTTRLLARFGRRVMTVGGGLLFTGLVVMAAVAGSSWPEVSALQLIPAMLLVGFGQGLIASPMFGVILSEVPVASAGVASGVLSTTQQISLALGTGLMGTLYASVSSPGSLGAGDGFAALVAVDALLAVVITVLTTRLPDPRAASAT